MSSTATTTEDLTKPTLEITKPGMYKVVFNNDNATPVDFVENLLISIFRHTEDRAKDITLEIHNQGRGIAGIYTFEIAEQKHSEATFMSRAQGHPLNINVEPE